MRWKRHFKQCEEEIQHDRFSEIQDRAIVLSKQISTQKEYNKVAEDGLNDLVIHNEQLNCRFTIARRYIIKHLGHKLTEKMRPFFNTWKQTMKRLKILDQKDKLIDLDKEQMIIPHRTEQYKELNEKLLTNRDKYTHKLDRLKELEQQVATLIREIKIAKIKLSDKNYDFEILTLENQRYKEELYIRSQSQSSFSSQFDSD